MDRFKPPLLVVSLFTALVLMASVASARDPAGPATSTVNNVTLPYSGSVSSSSTAFTVMNTGAGGGMVGYSPSKFGLAGVSANGPGVVGQSTAGAGVYGKAQNWVGVHGVSTNNAGVWGQSTGGAGVWGESQNWVGVHGVSVNQSGVWGKSTTHPGVYGESQNWVGVHGVSPNNAGVWGKSTSGAGLYGESLNWVGVHGISPNNAGVWGQSTAATGVYGESTNWYGVYGKSTNGYAGFFDGRMATKILEIQGGSDLAERFDVAGRARVEPGMLMVIDEANPGKLRPSAGPYDTKVAGVVSGAGGVRPGLTLHQEGVMEGGHVVAIAGRVYVKADATATPIKPGDLLTTSARPGHAMRATDRDRAYGAVIGKAMTGLDRGTGLVLVLVNLQ